MTSRSYYDARKTFLSSFAVSDIVDPLPSFDATTPASQVRAVLEAIGRNVAGVRDSGFVARYVTMDDLCEDTDGGDASGGSEDARGVNGGDEDARGEVACGERARAFDELMILPGSALLPDVVHALNEHDYVFVLLLGQVGGILHRADLEDPPVRMWLFGLLTSLEQRFAELIDERFTDDSWQQCLSPARLEKAQLLLAERNRRRQGGTLIGCLQFADKAQIMVRDETLRNAFGFASRKRAEETIKGLERLRNNLAHAQHISVSDWEMIVRIVENLDAVVERAAR